MGSRLIYRSIPFFVVCIVASILLGCVSSSQNTQDNRRELAWEFIQSAEILKNPVYPGSYIIDDQYNERELFIESIEHVGSDRYSKDAQYGRVRVSSAIGIPNRNEEFLHTSELIRTRSKRGDVYVLRYQEEYENNGKEHYWPNGTIVFDFENQYRIDDDIEYLGSSGGRTLKRKSDEFLSYTLDNTYDGTPEINRYYGFDTALALYPPLDGSSVRVGDQWEREFILHGSVFSNYLPNWMDGHQENGELILITYSFSGYAEVEGRLCAIIEYLVERYRMAITQEMDKEEFKRSVLALGKTSMKDIKAYIESDRSGDRQYGFNWFFPAGFSNTAQQESSKTLGILAYDVENNIIVNASAIQESLWIRSTDVNTVGIYDYTHSDVDIYRANISFDLQPVL